MRRAERRLRDRVDLPARAVARASFWLGGRQAEPAGTSPERPVWPGRVANLYAGGFQLVTRSDVTEALEIGETVGVRLVFGAGCDTVYSDAQIRHMRHVDDQALLGFQFLGLAHTPAGRQALQVISAKVGELQRLQSHAVAAAACPKPQACR